MSTAADYGPAALQLRAHRDAVLVPRHAWTDRAVGTGVLARATTGWRAVEGTGIRRRGREYVPAPVAEQVRDGPRLDSAVFGGFLFAHYGHFLLESLGRLWMRGLGDVPVVWIAATADRLTDRMSEMLTAIGVRNNAVVVSGETGPLEVGELLVPDPGFEVDRFLHPWFRRRLELTEAAPDPSHRRVWLSRSGLGDRGGLAEEAEIESLLAEAGWIIARLEHLPLAEQIELLAGASHLAGLEGSALHTLLFVREYRGTIDLFTRHASRNFDVIARVAGWDQTRHQLPAGRSAAWNRPSGARDVRWSGVDPSSAVDIILRSSCGLARAW